jgi:hypothetical protein
MNKLRSWVTPITLGSFLLIGVTGLLMFFKVRSSLIVVAHEWLSPIFLVGSCVHTVLNWSAVRAHLSRVRGLVIVGLFAVLLVLSLVPFDEAVAIARAHGHGDGEHGSAGRAAEVLLRARVSTLAELTGRTPERLRDRLRRYGIRVPTDEVTLAEAVRQSHAHPVQALDALLEEE